MNLLKFLMQPSTIRGLSLIAGSSVMAFNPEMINQAMIAIAGILGTFETFRNESKQGVING